MSDLRRSILYLPGSSERMMSKAGARGADVLALDLEDGVHPDAKGEARKQIREALPRYDWGESEVFIRMNGMDTPWGLDDAAMVADAQPKGAILPKAESAEMVASVADKLGVPLFLMIETAAGVIEAPSLARVEGVGGLLFGAADYRKSIHAGPLPNEEELLFARSQIVNAARAAGVDAFDTPWFEYKDLGGLEESSHRARQLGFDGKTAIHPSQVAPINRSFSPTAEEVERARRLVEVMEEALAQGKNVATMGDEMIEALHLEQARRVISRSESLPSDVSG